MHLAVAGDVFDGVVLCYAFFPRGVLDEIWDIIESVSKGFPTYSSVAYIITGHGQTKLNRVCCFHFVGVFLVPKYKIT